MRERITEAELREILRPKLPRKGIRRDGTMPWTSRINGGGVSVEAAARLVFEVRRYRELLVRWYATYAHEVDGPLTIEEEKALLGEARAILADHAGDEHLQDGV